MKQVSRMWLRGAAASALAMTLAAHAQAVPPESTAQELVPTPAPSITSDPAPPTMSESFSLLDRDKDGAVTMSEAERSEAVTLAFQRLDQSRDGRLDLAEFAQLRAPKSAHN